MRRSPLYSRAPQPGSVPAPQARAAHGLPDAAPTVPRAHLLARLGPWRPWRNALLAALWIGGGTVLAWHFAQPAPTLPTLQEIDKALRTSLLRQPLASPEGQAYEKIAPSVVRVVAFDEDDELKGDMVPADGPLRPSRPTVPKQLPHAEPEQGGPAVGTGVVIQDNGTILTNLHVVEGSHHLKVQFHDGLVADAQVVSADRSQDLAVIRALQLPDDLQPATLRGSTDLRPGDHVVAVGFPFGIGPSTSAGVVSGLGREFRTPDGSRTLRHLIQFDAAANPGNSGGPLVTQRGEVVGIVTAILNPTPARTFIGIGFAVPIENAAAAVGMPPF